MPGRHRRLTVLPGGASLVLAVLLGACTVAPVVRERAAPGSPVASSSAGRATAPATSAPVTPVPGPRTTRITPGAGTALAVLERLPVKGRAPRTGYRRELFGPRWADVDRNGCDTRNDVLRRQLRDVVTRPGTRGCVVQSGTLHDPYTGRVVHFVRGADRPAVDVDHVVALSDAWQKGAQQWDLSTRRTFANDPLNLLAVSAAANRAKAGSDAATWLPPNRAYRCPMVARQIAVKARYRLWVTRAERDAMRRVLAACPGRHLPSG